MAAFRVLLIEDDEDDFVLTRDLLRRVPEGSFDLEWAQGYDEGLRALCENRHDVCLVDYRLGGKNGVELLRDCLEGGAHVPMILLTGEGDHSVDLAAMEAGASDYLDKASLTPELLARSIRYSVQQHRMDEHRRRLLAVAQQQAAQLRLLASELTQAEQRERRRLAQTLHDHLQQLLVAAKLQLSLLAPTAPPEEIKETATNVDRLIMQAIEASRSLTVELSPPILHERGLAPALAWLSRWMKDKHGLEVAIEADPSAEPASPDQRALLFQAARELLFNVVKHAGVNRARVLLKRADGYVHLTIEDRGKGFTPKERSDRAASGEHFGLFSVQHRLALLGGRLDVESRPGEGSRLTLVAPVREAATPGEEAKSGGTRVVAQRPTDDDAGSKIRVLLADDHEMVRSGLASLLREQPDIEVVGEASDGLAAIELARQLSPHVVLMDISMPRMTGIEATRVLAADLPWVRVIGLSMHEKDDMAIAMRDAGAVGYLTKGGLADDLISAIRSSVATPVQAEK